MKTISVPHSLRETNTVNLALIGMSGAGKSYWSKKMEEKGYRWYNCDEMIAERLGPETSRKRQYNTKSCQMDGTAIF